MAVHYPDFDIPKQGEITLVAPGVFWLRMPLPFALNHINLYLLEDKESWTIVDTGLGGNTTARIWRQIFDKHLGGKPVSRVIVTHMHPDHVGQASFLTEHWRALLLMTQTEYALARAFGAPPSKADRWEEERYYTLAGLDPITVETAMASEGGFHRVVEPIGRSYIRLQQDTELNIGDNTWRVMVGRGHSPEHACLHCEALGVLISGDQILPAITPNISVYSTQPEADPLADYLQTLTPFHSLPADTLVLPAHNRPFTGLHERVEALKAHHQHQLDTLISGCQTPKTVAELLPVLFKRTLDEQQLMFGLGECLAHLNHLMYRGLVNRTLEADGAYRFQAS